MSTTTDTPSSTETEEEASPPRNKRRWLRRFIWFVGIIAVLIYFIQGLGVRKAGEYFINKSLEAQGMTGSLELAGSVGSGLQLKNVNYTGEQGIQLLEIDEVALDYKLLELKDLKIDLLKIDRVKAVIDIDKFPPSPKKDSEPTDWKQTLTDLKPMIMNPKIDISDLDVTVLKSGDTMVQAQLGGIQHIAQTNEIRLENWKVTDANGLSTPEQTSNLVWNESDVSFDRLELIPNLALGNINFDWENELRGNTSIEFHNALITLDVNENDSEDIVLSLAQGELKTEHVFATLQSFGISTDAFDTEAVLNQLEITIPLADTKLATPYWNLKSKLGIASARYETYTTKDTIITFDQAEQNYQLNVNGTALNTPLDVDVTGKWTNPNVTEWWGNTDVAIDLQTQINDSIMALIPQVDQIPTEINISSTKISLQANSSLVSLKPNASNANLELSNVRISNKLIPTIALDANFDQDILTAKLNTKETSAILLDAVYDTTKQTYSASFTADTDSVESPWFNDLATIYKAPISISDELDIVWKGSGDIPRNTHQGNLTSKDLILIQILENGQQNDPVALNIAADYNWPEYVNLENLSVKQQELYAQASLNWDGENINIRDSEIRRLDEPIGKITAKIPFNLEITDAKQFFNQTKDWEIVIDTEELRLKRISELVALPIPNGQTIQGTTQTQLTISGSPSDPSLNGDFNVKSLNDIFELGLANLTLDTKFVTEGKTLRIDGNIIEDGSELVDINLQLPFTPNKWLEDENLIETLQNSSQIQGVATIKRFPLNRLDKFAPQLEKIEGLLDVEANFTGTIADPKYSVNFLADLPIISLKDAGVDDITEIKLEGRIDQTMKLKSQLGAKINGGIFAITADADLNNPQEPTFDVKLNTQYALVYRDESVVVRTNADLRLAGSLENATLSGDIGLLESLFYKDIDLIPIGVPSNNIQTVSLPAIETKSTDTLPIPAPFDQWKLDLTLKTADPVLIRGNIGNGRVEGSVKVTGVLAKPSLSGKFYTREVTAKLPFSNLVLDTGEVIFKPNSGFIPEILVIGKSQIGEYNVTINAYGSVSNPQLTLSSFPALPETEIMTLLATGATNDSLTNSDVATFKTLQLLLQELKQRSERPGGNRLFSKLLDGVDKLNLKVGEENQLTGDKFSSATFKLHRRWFLSAQIDNNQPPQTRGLLIFALRFN